MTPTYLEDLGLVVLPLKPRGATRSRLWARWRWPGPRMMPPRVSWDLFVTESLMLLLSDREWPLGGGGRVIWRVPSGAMGMSRGNQAELWRRSDVVSVALAGTGSMEA